METVESASEVSAVQPCFTSRRGPDATEFGNGRRFASAVIKLSASVARIEICCLTVFAGGTMEVSSQAPGSVQVVRGQPVRESEKVRGLGTSLALVGDLNADGVPDLFAGAPLHDRYVEATAQGVASLQSAVGSAWLVSGKDGSVIRSWRGDEAGDLFGAAVSGIGDVNADSVPDLLVGSPGGLAGSGYVRLISGSDGSVIRTLRGERNSERFGSSIAVQLKAKADSSALLAVGAADILDLVGSRGRVYVIETKAFSLLRIHESMQFGSGFGNSIAFGNGASSSDSDLIAIGAPTALVAAEGSGSCRVGSVHVYSLDEGREVSSLFGVSEGDLFGSSMCFLDTKNPLVRPSLVVGAPGYSLSCPDAGTARVFACGTWSMRLDCDTFRGQCVESVSAPRQSSQFGCSMGNAGDVDQDGTEDFIVGALTGGFGSQSDFGRAEVISGRTGGSLCIMSWRSESLLLSEFGKTAICIGDVNNDGHPEFAIGATNSQFSGGGIQVASLGGATNPCRANVLYQVLAEELSH